MKNQILETIRKEIISRIDKRHLSAQAKNELVSVLSFLDSLESEKPIDGLEEEIERIVKCEKEFMNFQFKSQLIGYVARHFAQWGAEHTREELMKEAVEGFIFQSEDYYPKELIANYNGELKHGDKVRIIIVKEEAKKPVPNDLEEAAKYIDEDDFD